jgi:hypothetical protein
VRLLAPVPPHAGRSRLHCCKRSVPRWMVSILDTKGGVIRRGGLWMCVHTYIYAYIHNTDFPFQFPPVDTSRNMHSSGE